MAGSSPAKELTFSAWYQAVSLDRFTVPPDREEGEARSLVVF